MEKISVYKLSDGTLVENREEAEKLQSMITFKKKLDHLLDVSVCYGSDKIIFDFVTDNTEALKEMLNELK